MSSLLSTRSSGSDSSAKRELLRCPTGTIYGTNDREGDATQGKDNKYDLESLLTWKILLQWQGSVFKSQTLWMQTGLLAVGFWTLYVFLLYHRSDGFSEIVGNEASIRAFLSMFSMLIGLLLSFYTALSLNRWWSMRMSVETVEGGCKRLVMMVSQGVSSDAVLLSNISRYARASLFLVFTASQRTPSDELTPLDKAIEMGLITAEEKTKLIASNAHCPYVQAESLWVWLANAITRCHDQGLTKGPPHYCALMAAIEAGRSGIATIQAHLETPIPFGYAHLLCMMVKLHNLLVTVLMAMTCVMHSGGDKGVRPVSIFRTAFRAFFMPFLYNALLLLNATLADPFGGDEADFDWTSYDRSMTNSSTSYTKAADQLPEWMKGKKFKPVTDAAGKV